MLLERAAGVAVFVSVLLAPACTTTETRVYTIPSSGSPTETWKGHTESEVLETWGKPTEKQPDGEGGMIWIYQTDTGLSSSVGDSAGAPPTLSPRTPDGPQHTTAVKREHAKFWIDARGVVYRFWFSPEVFATDRDTPPPAGD